VGPDPETAHHERLDKGRAALALGALGVVFGDIGTSPLYTLAVCTKGEHGADPPEVLGVLSLVFWALTLVVTVKYLTFVLRADNDGEGGILALLALLPRERGPSDSPGRHDAPRVRPASRVPRARVGWVAVLVLIGAGLLYGDGIITPAISVLSAVEGLRGPLPELSRAVVPITCVILLALFAIQRRGAGAVGRLFGPVMLAWFIAIGGLGAWQIAGNVGVLRALSPYWAADYFARHGIAGVAILGGVVLAVTGGEVLYADMGHFGRKPIRAAWFAVVFPGLTLAYFGQGALLLREPWAASSPFFSMAPAALRLPLVALSTCATIIASQALISGAYSLTYQAVQLGFFPRVTVRHTSQDTEGQIYLPGINWALAVACIALVVGFGASERLAAAYGIAVSATMGLTSIVYFVVTRRRWRWPLVKAVPLLALFLAADVPFFFANTLKFFDGGYIPVAVGAVMFVIMFDWRMGRLILAERTAARSQPAAEFLGTLDERVSVRVPGTAVFLTSHDEGVPELVSLHVQRIRALHECVVLLTLHMEHVPVVLGDDRVRYEDLGKGFHRIVGRYGFMRAPHVPRLLALARERFGAAIDLETATYYLGRETFLATDKGRMGAWAESLFGVLSRNARSATAYFSIPPEQVLELGTQIDL
jgi:KUP system potassium uptake protein